jgi:3-hydroxyisobutyrate dehydrogenase
MSTTGFVGLGNMGRALSENLVQAGHDVVTYDVAGPSSSPKGAEFVQDASELAARAEIVVFSLPDGDASEQVAARIANAPDRQTAIIIDTSTVGVAASHALHSLCTSAGLGYIDAPVSGGVAGAKARTLSVMYAAPEETCTRAETVLAGLSDNRRRVGAEPGMAQALKLANNFLSATALAATSEAVAFGLSNGLDMATMLEVLNTSSGQSAASSDKFVNHVLTGRYSSGFTNSLMAKDLQLYLETADALNAPRTLGAVTRALWMQFAAEKPAVDFTRIYPFVAER